MAIPRVFISSTCYDLRHIRANLMFFIGNMGFQPVMSETGGVFYDPSKHVQDACLSEVRTCQLFVLIIGGKLGSPFKETSESVTNHEYREALSHKIPVFAVVERPVYEQHHVYVRNRDNASIDRSRVEYPAVDSTKVFDFMDEVMSNPLNNALTPFTDFSELQTYLQRQWAGMMFSFLAGDAESRRVSDIVESLRTVSDRVEFLSRQILASVGTDSAKLAAELNDVLAGSVLYKNVQNWWSQTLRLVDVLSEVGIKELLSHHFAAVSVVDDLVVEDGPASWLSYSQPTGPALELSTQSAAELAAEYVNVRKQLVRILESNRLTVDSFLAGLAREKRSPKE